MKLYLPLPVTHACIAVYVKEGLAFACGLSLENSEDFCLYFRLALLNTLPYFTFIDHRSRLYALFSMLFDITCKFLSIDSSANIIVFGPDTTPESVSELCVNQTLCKYNKERNCNNPSKKQQPKVLWEEFLTPNSQEIICTRVIFSKVAGNFIKKEAGMGDSL